MKIKLLTITTVISALLLAGCWGKSDADLGKAAGDKLKANAATSGVTVEVKGGVATIKGEVKDEASKTAAAAAAKVEGVKSVTNEVTVAQAAPAASAADPELKTKVEEAIKKTGVKDISVEAKDGIVTLRGSVSKDKLPVVIQAANEAKPKKVDNQLQVK